MQTDVDSADLTLEGVAADWNLKCRSSVRKLMLAEIERLRRAIDRNVSEEPGIEQELSDGPKNLLTILERQRRTSVSSALVGRLYGYSVLWKTLNAELVKHDVRRSINGDTNGTVNYLPFSSIRGGLSLTHLAGTDTTVVAGSVDLEVPPVAGTTHVAWASSDDGVVLVEIDHASVRLEPVGDPKGRAADWQTRMCLDGAPLGDGAAILLSGSVAAASCEHLRRLATLLMAAQNLGIAQRAFTEARQWVLDLPLGKDSGNDQYRHFRLADAFSQVELLRSLLRNVVRKVDLGEFTPRMQSELALCATSTARRAAALADEIVGGNPEIVDTYRLGISLLSPFGLGDEAKLHNMMVADELFAQWREDSGAEPRDQGPISSIKQEAE